MLPQKLKRFNYIQLTTKSKNVIFFINFGGHLEIFVPNLFIV